MDDQDQQGPGSTGGNSSDPPWEVLDMPETSESSPECQNCPTCKSSLIPSRTVFYHGVLKDDAPINPQNQAAETKNNSLWCPKCNVNFVTLNKVEEGLWGILQMGMDACKELYNKVAYILSYFSGNLAPTTVSYLTGYHIVKFSSFITGQTFGAEQALMEKVRNKIPATLVEEVNPKDAHAFLVVCPITSRVGSDVESAMANPEVSSVDKPMILVLMHHTRDPDYSTAGTKWSEVYKNVVLDVHVFFHETEPGLLTCQQNDQAIEAIEKKLYSYKEYRT